MIYVLTDGEHLTADVKHLLRGPVGVSYEEYGLYMQAIPRAFRLAMVKEREEVRKVEVIGRLYERYFNDDEV